MSQNTSHTAEYYDQYVLNMNETNSGRTLQRVNTVLQWLGQTRQGELLTIGAGQLNEPIAFKEAGFDVSVADIATTQFDNARQAGITPHQVDLDTQNIPGQYDVVCCMEVLEHLMNPMPALQKIGKAVREGGRLFISLPEEFHIVTRLQVAAGRPAFSAYDCPHVRFFNYRSACRLISDAGFDIIRARHMPLMPVRWPAALQPLGNCLARTMPSLFSISHVFELRNHG